MRSVVQFLPIAGADASKIHASIITNVDICLFISGCLRRQKGCWHILSGKRKCFLSVLQGCKSIETLLLGMYNLEVVAESGEPVVLSFRLPSLAQGSLYHEPTREAFTESALRRFEEVNTKPVTWGPHLQAEVVNAQNRIKIVTALLFIFNRRIGTFHKCALKDLCRAASRWELFFLCFFF